MIFHVDAPVHSEPHYTLLARYSHSAQDVLPYFETVNLALNDY